MNILLIHQFFLEDHDGGGSRWNEIGKVWRAQGHNITVLAGTVHYMGHQLSQYKGKWCVSTVNKDGISVIRCYVPASYNHGYFNRLFAYISFIISSSYAGLFRARDNYDLIIVTSPPLFVGITGLFLSWVKRTPFLFEVRDLWPESAIDAGVVHNKYLIKASLWLEKKLYKKALAISVLTPAFSRILVENKKVSEEKIILSTNAADFELVEQVTATMDIGKFRAIEGFANLFTVVYVGAHGPVNDLQTVLKTAQILQNEPVHFLFIGDGTERANLIREATEKRLTNVRFIGFKDKRSVFQYILAADAGLSILTKTDTFKTVYSNKTFDYFSCRKPVLMAIDGVSRDLIEQADAGMFVKPENEHDLARKILNYVQDPELVATHGENGYIYAKCHFERKKLALRYLEEIVNRLSLLNSPTI